MGISTLFGFIAFIGLLVFVLGLALIVVNASQGKAVRGGVLLAILGLIAALIFFVVSSGLIIVQPQQVAVVFNVLGGDLRDPPLTSGVHVVVPLVNEVTFYDISQQEYTMSATEAEGAQRGDDSVQARTSDGQEVNIDVTVIYNIDPSNANIVHLRWRSEDRIEQSFVRPTVRNLVRNEVSAFNAEALYGESRSDMETQAEDTIREAFLAEGLQLTGFLVREVNFSTEFVQAIEQKVVAEQELQRAETEAQTAQTRARGEAEAQIEQARGDAESAIERARGQAEGLRLVNEQLSANPLLIQYLYVQNLSDNINLILLPSNSPFLFDLNQLTEMSGTTAPAPTPAPPGDGS